MDYGVVAVALQYVWLVALTVGLGAVLYLVLNPTPVVRVRFTHAAPVATRDARTSEARAASDAVFDDRIGGTGD